MRFDVLFGSVIFLLLALHLAEIAPTDPDPLLGDDGDPGDGHPDTTPGPGTLLIILAGAVLTPAWLGLGTAHAVDGA